MAPPNRVRPPVGRAGGRGADEALTGGSVASTITDLDIAKAMAAAGIPIFVAHPNSSPLGFRLPDSWQTTTPNPRYVDAWRPGMALCAVMGCGLDLVDSTPATAVTRPRSMG